MRVEYKKCQSLNKLAPYLWNVLLYKDNLELLGLFQTSSFSYAERIKDNR